MLYRMGISRREALDGPRACTCAARPCARACRRRRQRRIEHPVIAPRAPAVQGQHAEMCERDAKTSLSCKTPTSNLHFVIIDINYGGSHAAMRESCPSGWWYCSDHGRGPRRTQMSVSPDQHVAEKRNFPRFRSPF